MLTCGALWAADDPLVGKWKVIPAQCILTDQMKVASLGGSKYAITFGPGAVDTIVADGTDQPGLRGTTLAVTITGPGGWKVVRKKDGRMMVMGVWTLSEDGTKLNDDYTSYKPDGSATTSRYVYERTAGDKGFIGTWDTVMTNVDPSLELTVQPYEGDGLALAGPFAAMGVKLRLDGKEYSNPNPGEGFVCSGRRVDSHRVEITDKFEGKVRDTREVRVSSDRKTLTIATRMEGESKPRSVYVFERK